MNLKALFAFAAIALCAGVLLGVAIDMLHPHTRYRSVPPTLTDRAEIALQASFNTSQTLKEIPIRLIGQVNCKVTKVWSPTAESVSCLGTGVGPHQTGGCVAIVGIYYDKMALFAESFHSTVPCADGSDAAR